MVWIFQQGHLSKLPNFSPTGLIDTTTPITMFCIAFGLSMDYEVSLLSRIKEEYDRTEDNTASVALGLPRTGRLVTRLRRRSSPWCSLPLQPPRSPSSSCSAWASRWRC
jgi:uncharacterized membrane protein YdfJ with MMPL/SSD domain